MSDSEKQIKQIMIKKDATNYIIVGALAAFFVICVELFRRMTVSYPGILGTYYSDINVRLGMGEDHYSIFLIPEYFFIDKFGLNLGGVFIGIYLSAVVIGTILLVYLLLKKICSGVSAGLLFAFSFVCILAIPIFIPIMSERIFSPYAGSVWHNESYLGMRFMAVLILLYFYRTNETYLERFSLKDFFISSLLFLLVNWIKPNFIIAFGPAMLIMMIVDIIRAKGKHFVRWMLYGIPVLIGSLILPFQYLILFPGNDSSSGNGSGVTLIFGDFFFVQKHPIINLLFAIAFPVFMFIIHRKEFIKSKFHMVCSLGWVFAFLEFFFMSETGIRRGHENFYWGVRFFTFLVFCLSIGYFINDLRAYRMNKKKNSADKENSKRNSTISLFFVENMFVLLHLLAGLVYFILVVLGSRASEL